jgi:hypothetical protein
VATEPPPTVVQGGHFGTIVEAQIPNGGGVQVGFAGDATISLASGPPGATFTPVTVPFANGMAVFDGLSLATLSNGTPYTFNITVTNPSGATLQTLTTSSVNVATAATTGVAVYYPLPLDSSLRDDVAAANADSSNATDDLSMVYSTTYDLTTGQLVLQNTSNLSNKVIQFIGQDELATTPPSISGDGFNRVFQIIGANNGTANLSVLFQDLVIEDGLANGLLGNMPAGGGLLIEGGSVTLKNVTLEGNQAAGGTGSGGASGTSPSGGPGGAGQAGGAGQGGAIYISSGSLKLDDDVITGNIAREAMAAPVGQEASVYPPARAARAVRAVRARAARCTSQAAT